MLTSRLVRMEYSPSSVFEDHPSQAFWRRELPVPEFNTRFNGRLVDIETEYLRLRYAPGADGFTPAALSALVKATGVTWRYGDLPWRGGNLWGTARTLDEAGGKVRLEPGLVSRSGWAVVDDASSLVFGEDGWLEQRAQPENLDLYLFAYGHDYAACLQDFTQIAGRQPLIPRWILGNWWSRYWAYQADELLDLMEEFKANETPLSVCIVDMDWHLTNTGNASSGWTGYTWNRELFPDPPAFLQALHRLGLRTALNLHPAEGVYPHEEAYAEFARRVGRDPASGEAAPFDCADRSYMQAYFDLLHHPLEAQGVDFWWIDWQQGGRSRLDGLDPLWWLNHLHFYDLGRDGKQRPFIFSRWGGLGNHRYPIGFSGDTVVGWEALDFQPYFTATAANVGYGWWSHDIGGHMGGIEEDELYARWVQYGAFSPILRMHCTNNPYHERRPWGRGPAAGSAARAALRLRHALIPYLYTMAWRAYQTGLSLALPLYYAYPEAEEAYYCPQQYLFGTQLLAAPFTQPAEAQTGLSRQAVWFPPTVPFAGDGEAAGWFHFFSGEYLPGGAWRTVYGALDEIPVYARAGAIVPLSPEAGWGGVEVPEQLHLYVFPGADNRFDLYEDDGQTTAYQQGAYALTAFSQQWSGERLRLSIEPAAGEVSVLPPLRTYYIHLRGVCLPEQVRAWIDDMELRAAYTYDNATDTLSLAPLELRPQERLLLEVSASNDLLAHHDRRPARLRQYLGSFRLDTWIKQRIERDWPQIAAGDIPLRAYRALTDAQIAVLESLLSHDRPPQV